jgi:hypothetical protein
VSSDTLQGCRACGLLPLTARPAEAASSGTSLRVSGLALTGSSARFSGCNKEALGGWREGGVEIGNGGKEGWTMTAGKEAETGWASPDGVSWGEPHRWVGARVCGMRNCGPCHEWIGEAAPWRCLSLPAGSPCCETAWVCCQTGEQGGKAGTGFWAKWSDPPTLCVRCRELNCAWCFAVLSCRGYTKTGDVMAGWLGAVGNGRTAANSGGREIGCAARP